MADQRDSATSMPDAGKPGLEPPHTGDALEADALNALGYEESYRRVLRTLSTVCMVISLTSPCLAILLSSFYQITYGGFWGLIWGWTISTIIFLPQALAVAELVSAMPVNGCFYWWTAALAPMRFRRFLSFISGWTNLLALVTAVASFAFASAQSLQAAIAMLQPEWETSNAQLMSLSMGFVAMWMCLAAFRLEDIAWIYIGGAGILFVHLLVYLIALPTAHAVQHQPFASGADVFGSYTNYSDWSRPVAVTFTFFTAVWSNSAWTTPAYVVETTHDGRRSAAKAIITSYLITGGTGLAVCLVAAFCVVNMDDLAADPSGLPLFTQLTDNWGTTPTAAFLLISTIVTGVGGSAQTLSYACQIAAFARDGGVPWSQYLSRINKRVNMPVTAILVLGAASVLTLLFALSTVAKQIIYSLSTIAYLITMGLPNWLVLFAGDKYVKGPVNWGRFSMPIFACAGASQIYLIIMESFPPQAAWTAETFNYSWVLTLAVLLLACGLWLIIGKKYTGPDFEALEHWRHEVSIQGIVPAAGRASNEDENSAVDTCSVRNTPKK